MTSVPFAYFGGILPLTGRAQALVLGLALLAGSIRLLFFARPPSLNVRVDGALYYAIAAVLGAALGFVAGATGIGGGIFLSPILIALGWGEREGSGERRQRVHRLEFGRPPCGEVAEDADQAQYVAPFVAVVVVGALVGSFMGARRLLVRAVQISLGLVLLIAAARNLLGRNIFPRASRASSPRQPVTSIGTSRKRACAAPWPTRINCRGSPFAHERKPCSSQSSATPSQRPQKSGVSDWNATPRT